jgi:hypothetical protein
MIPNSIFIPLDSSSEGRVGPVVLHANWREYKVLTGMTNAPRAIHADGQSFMLVPPVTPISHNQHDVPAVPSVSPVSLGLLDGWLPWITTCRLWGGSEIDHPTLRCRVALNVPLRRCQRCVAGQFLNVAE